MNASAALDDQTTNAIRQALGAASRGMLAEACEIGERALAGGGDAIALNAMLGMLRCQSGQLDAGIVHLQIAHQARPNDIKIGINLANALASAGREQEALQILTDELARSDKTHHLLKLRGFLAQNIGDFDASIEAYERVIAADPNDFESWNNLGNARRGGGDFEGGVEALQRAVDLAPDSAPIRLNLATAIIHTGDWNAAEAVLRKMAEDFPNDPKPFVELHALLKEWGHHEVALDAIEEAIQRAPNDIPLLLGKASLLSDMTNSIGAEAVYRQVLELDDDNAMAHLGLALCFDLTNQTDKLSALVQQAQERDIGPNALNFIRAYDHRRGKRFAEALTAIGQVPDDLESVRRAHLTGQLLEGLGRHDEAYQSYVQMNEISVKISPRSEEIAVSYRNMVRGRRETTTEEWVSQWRPEARKDPRPTPVFLFGFPRSGTTLLDTMLMGHPSIEVLEEEPTLHPAFRLLSHDELPVATDDEIQAARDGYFETVASLTPLKPGNLLVDKNPLAINAVPYIRRLFPDARIILALRHPCDVVLSCVVTNFRLNDGMSSFTRLDTAAELYDLSFSYFERVQSLMPTPTHTVMYEKVVADRDSELRALFDFLGLDWHDAVLDHQSTALARGRIKTASYAQVVEPIYQRSAGRWQNYRKHLEPIFPVLRPWVEKFGYSLDPLDPADKG
jgi:tetratricopeptide (TPR) repeat protein